jgi:hypothetical protein
MSSPRPRNRGPLSLSSESVKGRLSTEQIGKSAKVTRRNGDSGPMDRDEFDFPLHSWRQLVRFMARRWPPHMLTARVRRAAERDPELEWDAQRNCYRRRFLTTPAQPLATPHSVDGEGSQKLSGGLDRRPAAARNKNANMGFRPGEASGADARGRSRPGARGDDS